MDLADMTQNLLGYYTFLEQELCVSEGDHVEHLK